MQIGGVNSLREAARWGETPIIKKKAVEASKNAMTDDFVKKLQELARRDAQKGGGMSQEAINLCHAQMGKYVSPDRSAPIAQMTQELQKAEKAHKGEDPTLEFLDRMLAQLKGKGRPERIVKSFSGLAGGCSGDLHSTPENQVATVYSPDGEEIAQYNYQRRWLDEFNYQGGKSVSWGALFMMAFSSELIPEINSFASPLSCAAKAVISL